MGAARWARCPRWISMSNPTSGLFYWKFKVGNDMKNECLAVKQPGLYFIWEDFSMPTYFNNKHADQYGRDNDKKEVLIMETISSNTMIINGFVVSKSGMMPPCSEIKIRFSGVSYFKFKKVQKISLRFRNQEEDKIQQQRPNSTRGTEKFKAQGKLLVTFSFDPLLLLSNN